MSINQVPAVSTLRQPRALAQVNGTSVGTVLSLELEQTLYGQPSSFQVEFPLAGLPSGADANWWSSTQDEIDVEVFIGFPDDPDDFDAGDLALMFSGRADDFEIDWSNQQISVSGRDLSAKMADAKSADKYINQTASQVAATLAGKYGLTPVVTATKTLVGKYYEYDHVHIQSDKTDWDLLTWLARNEQFVCFVSGKSLYFQPKPSANQDRYTFQFTPGAATGSGAAFSTGNFERLTTHRELTVKTLKIEVLSWNAKHAKSYAKTAGSGDQARSYVYPGLDPDATQARADQLLAELSQHEKKITVEGPADNSLSLADVIQVAGTGTAFDQAYFPTSIKRELSLQGGYRWTIEGQAIPPADEGDSA